VATPPRNVKHRVSRTTWLTAARVAPYGRWCFLRHGARTLLAFVPWRHRRIAGKVQILHGVTGDISKRNLTRASYISIWFAAYADIDGGQTLLADLPRPAPCLRTDVPSPLWAYFSGGSRGARWRRDSALHRATMRLCHPAPACGVYFLPPFHSPFLPAAARHSAPAGDVAAARWRCSAPAGRWWRMICRDCLSLCLSTYSAKLPLHISSRVADLCLNAVRRLRYWTGTAWLYGAGVSSLFTSASYHLALLR